MNSTLFSQSLRSVTCLLQGNFNIEINNQSLVNLIYYFRLQKEKEDAFNDIDRSREKYEKLQVKSSCKLCTFEELSNNYHETFD